MIAKPHTRSFASLSFVLLFALVGAFARAADTPSAPDAAQIADHDAADRDYSAELPRLNPTEPADALATFELRPGFQLQLAASEPLVADPVALAFDADSRLYTVEMRGYSEQPDEALGQVRLLTDNDGDGAFDQSTLFLEGLSWPTAIHCYDGGVFIADAPDIIYARDNDGDGVADQREVVFTGFGKSNVQGLLNSFAWGLDNVIHGATSSSGGKITRPDAPDQPAIDLSGRDFAFDPRTRRLTPTSGGGQHGLTFDDWGHKFVCHNSDHIMQVMFEDRYLARNPYLAPPSPRKSIAADGPQAEVFRISEVEPWRIVRTRLRKKGIVPGIVEGGGRPAGYFTSATGVTIYRGDAWPAELRDQVFVGDVGSNVVHRKTLDTSGIEFVAHRADPGVEFLASRDIWFRPAQFANGPDGNLYILDVYREVIEHPHSIPPIIKQHLDLTSGRDRGRLYRVTTTQEPLRPWPKLSKLSSAELVALLAHPNSWHRETAARLLYERQDPTSVEPARHLARDSQSPLGRIHALYTLAGFGALTADDLLPALRDPNPHVRRHAIRLSERVESNRDQLFNQLASLTADPDLHVRYQLAFTLGQDWPGDRIAPLVALAKHDLDNPWIQLAIQSSLRDGAGLAFQTLAKDPALRDSDAGQDLLLSLATQIGRQKSDDDLNQLFATLDALPPDAAPFVSRALLTLGSAASSQLANYPHLRATLSASLNSARTTATNNQLDAPARVAAIRLLALAQPADTLDILSPLLASQQPQEVQTAALDILAQLSEPKVAQALLAPWPGYSPTLRRQVTEALFLRADRLQALLAAISAGDLAPTDIEPARWQQLAQHSDSAVRAAAEPLVKQLQLGRRGDVVEAYRSALTLTGDRTRGRDIFRKQCAVCHKIEGFGHEIGPNLATIQNRGPEAILLNVLDPNREVNPQYVNYVCITDDGRSLTGMLAAETATSVTLMRAESAQDTVLRLNIDDLRSTSLSLMPEGLEKEISPQAMADLIAYLSSLN
jgi:putative membrane-bound dehydrogenase-like protein